VIIVTHQISDALKLADQFVVIVDGYLVFDGNFDQLRECRTPQVVEFLAPFRESVDDIVKRQFI
jgi:ABC-type transporter Mla maintaining outer membrane lipid asymmetry ATPase subunit MlaF